MKYITVFVVVCVCLMSPDIVYVGLSDLYTNRQGYRIHSWCGVIPCDRMMVNKRGCTSYHGPWTARTASTFHTCEVLTDKALNLSAEISA